MSTSTEVRPGSRVGHRLAKAPTGIRGFLDVANLVVTFDGDLGMHRQVQVPEWAMSLPPERFCHFVYGVPEDAIDDVRRRVARSNAGTLYITDGLAPNPWGTLAKYWEKLAEHG